MPELLDKLNQVVVEGGHALVKRAKESCVGGATPVPDCEQSAGGIG
jgi:hypothetical protein